MICPYCRSALSRNIVVCQSCGTAHHRSCWSRHQRCSVFGCKGSAESNRKRSTKWTVLIAAAIFLSIVSMFLFTALRFGAASAEFGSAGGHLALRQGVVIPTIIISVLLIAGMISFIVSDFRR